MSTYNITKNKHCSFRSRESQMFFRTPMLYFEWLHFDGSQSVSEGASLGINFLSHFCFLNLSFNILSFWKFLISLAHFGQIYLGFKSEYEGSDYDFSSYFYAKFCLLTVFQNWSNFTHLMLRYLLVDRMCHIVNYEYFWPQNVLPKFKYAKRNDHLKHSLQPT